jgi:hypothetical protein
MLDSLTNYFWQHPLAIAIGAIAGVIILIWMTGSGSRQRFVTFKRTKETDQLARDLSRIAAALERIAKSQETPTDYVGRPIPPQWEESIPSGEPAEEISQHAQASPGNGQRAPVPAAVADERAEAAAASSSVNPAAAPNRLDTPPRPRENSPSSFVNPLGGTSDLLGNKKKLDLPNPLYRPK